MSPPVTVYLDLTRMLGRADRAAPTGIDRWDLEGAARLLAGVPGLRLSPVVQVGGVLRRLPAAGALIAAAAQGRPRPWARWRRLAGRLSAQPALPGVYLSLSHQGLDHGPLWADLAAFGLPSVVYLHDLIPLSHPALCRPAQVQRHAKRLAHACAHAAQILCPSHAVAAELNAWAKARQHALPPVTVLPPGLPDWALGPAAPRTGPVVMLATLEPRKGHELLPALWEGWAEAPDLLVIGQRGWNGAAIARALRDAPALKAKLHLQEAPPDEDLAALLATARALILPSRGEGWGMPVSEAVALGVPVVCTDLPALREAGGNAPTYLPLPDTPVAIAAWRAALSSPATQGPPPPAVGWDAGLAPLWAILREVGA